MIRALFVDFFVIAGGFFILVAGIGIIRMPDLPMRMHAATKSGSLGPALVLLAVAIDSTDAGIMVRAIAIIVFLFLTAPVAASTIGRAALRSRGIQLWDRTVINEYRPDARELDAPTEPAAPVRPAPDAPPAAKPDPLV